MFGWREDAVFLVVVTVVCGSLDQDLTKFKAVMAQANIYDFLDHLSDNYPSYLRLCKAQIDANRRSQALPNNLKVGIAALNAEVQTMTPEFIVILKDNQHIFSDFKNLYSGLSYLKKCEKIRRDYIISVGQIEVEAKQRQYRNECEFETLVDVSTFLVDGWRMTDRGKKSYIQKFRASVYDAPETMVLSVRDWIKYLIRYQLLFLTAAQLNTSASSDDGEINSLMTNQSRDINEVAANAKLVFKSISDNTMVQIKEDLIRYLKWGNPGVCDKSADLLRYLKNKYERFDFAVMISKGNKYVMIKYCASTTAYRVAGWTGFVLLRPAAYDNDKRKQEKLKWMDGAFKSMRNDFWTDENKGNAMWKELESTIGSGKSCKNFTLAAVMAGDLLQCFRTSGFVTDQVSKTVYKCIRSWLCWLTKLRTSFRIYLLD